MLRLARVGLGHRPLACAPMHYARAHTKAQVAADVAPSFFSTFVRVIAWLPVALFITNHVATLANVRGTSMSPTFNPLPEGNYKNPGPLQSTDVVLLNRLVTATRHYKKGDIVTMYSPSEPTKVITKRILALGGDTVHLWVPRGLDLRPAPPPGTRSDLQSLAYTQLYQDALRDLASEVQEHETGAWMSIKIPPNCAWVEGDASALQSRHARLHPEMKSRDSREFGPVPLGLINARIDWIVWPLNRFGPPPPRPHAPLP